MIVYMEHPKHGRMPCYSTQEIEFNRKHGWKEENEQSHQVESATPIISVTTSSQEVAKTPESGSERQNAIEQYITKFGKPPHHRMKTENILKAIYADSPTAH